jgi:hypothetical protein
METKAEKAERKEEEKEASGRSIRRGILRIGGNP